MDEIDRVSDGHVRTCAKCGATRSDMQAEVVAALMANHMRREHPESA